MNDDLKRCTCHVVIVEPAGDMSGMTAPLTKRCVHCREVEAVAREAILYVSAGSGVGRRLLARAAAVFGEIG